LAHKALTFQKQVAKELNMASVNPFSPVRRICTSMRYPGWHTLSSWHRNNYTTPDCKCSDKTTKTG